MMKKIIFVGLLLWLLQLSICRPCLVAQSNVLTKQIDSILENQVLTRQIAGAVILVKKNNSVICRKAFGYAQLYDDAHVFLKNPEKMTAEHLFDIASLTKVVGTTTSLMLLVDKGLIHLDDKVGKYIPAFMQGEKSAITIRHLLTHTAGLYEWYPMYYRAADKQATFQLIGELPLAFPVGKERKYSDLGFTILGQLIEIVSGEAIDHYMDAHIFKPLRMMHTGYLPLQKFADARYAATSVGNPYEKRMVFDSSLHFQFAEIKHDSWNGWRNYTLKGEVNDGNAWYAGKGISGAAGLFSTADDLQKLVDMLIQKGLASGQIFISDKTIAQFLAKDAFQNGLGWMMDPANSVIKNGPTGSFGHTGFTGTSIAVIPAQGISVILLINRQQVGLLNGKEYYNVSTMRQKIFKLAMDALSDK